MKFLVCTDGSEQSKKAMQAAVKIAAVVPQARITVIHIIPSPTLPVLEGNIPLDTHEYLRNLNREEGEKVILQAQKIFEDHRLKVDTMLVEGHTITSIVEAAAEGRFDLVVIGSRGLSGLKKIFLGSVSNAVVQELKTNVLVIKGEPGI